ncbi:hypothetical protein ANN_16831, partial [Periplaneta americana]
LATIGAQITTFGPFGASLADSQQQQLQQLQHQQQQAVSISGHPSSGLAFAVEQSCWLQPVPECSDRHQGCGLQPEVILPIVLYGCETWTLNLREEHRLRVFENKVLRKIFGAKRDEVTGEWRRLHNIELHALYSSPDIIRNIKFRRLRWAGHVARIGASRNAYRVLVGSPEGKRPLERPRRRWEDNIKMDLREVGYDVSSVIRSMMKRGFYQRYEMGKETVWSRVFAFRILMYWAKTSAFPASAQPALSPALPQQPLQLSNSVLASAAQFRNNIATSGAIAGPTRTAGQPVPTTGVLGVAFSPASDVSQLRFSGSFANYSY